MTHEVPESGPSLLQSHRPSRITLRGGYRNGTGSVLGGGARWLLHGAVDPYIGYPPVSSVEVGRIEFDVTASGQILIDEATALRIERLAPASGFQSALAWKIDIGARRVGYGNESPLHIGAEFGVGTGASLQRPDYSVTVYSMVGARPGAALVSGGTRFMPAGIGSGGLLFRLPGDVRARVSGEYALSLKSMESGSASLAAVVRKGLTQDWDFELAVTRGPGRSGATFGIISFH